MMRRDAYEQEQAIKRIFWIVGGAFIAVIFVNATIAVLS